LGVVVALTFQSTLDEPARFARSRDLGPYLGPVPRQHQPGETGYVGSITRISDVMLRAALHEAATTILRRTALPLIAARRCRPGRARPG
jgi:transposase